MWSLIIGIILCVILGASAIGLVIIGIVERRQRLLVSYSYCNYYYCFNFYAE